MTKASTFARSTNLTAIPPGCWRVSLANLPELKELQKETAQCGCRPGGLRRRPGTAAPRTRVCGSMEALVSVASFKAPNTLRSPKLPALPALAKTLETAWLLQLPAPPVTIASALLQRLIGRRIDLQNGPLLMQHQ